MQTPATTSAPPDCGSCGADDELVSCTDPGGSVLLCRLCVMALIGSTEASVAVLLFDAADTPWERGDDRTDGSGPDLPDWPEEKEN